MEQVFFNVPLSKLGPVFKEWIRDVLDERKPTENIVRPPATRKQAADFLGLSLPTLDTLIKTNQLKAFNIGRQVRIDWSELDSFINKGGE